MFLLLPAIAPPGTHFVFYVKFSNLASLVSNVPNLSVIVYPSLQVWFEIQASFALSLGFSLIQIWKQAVVRPMFAVPGTFPQTSVELVNYALLIPLTHCIIRRCCHI
jgi:hypothetical protein